MAWPSFLSSPWRRASVIAGLVILSVLIGARLFLMTPMAHSIVENRVEALSVRGQTIALDGIRGDLFSGIQAERIRVSDDQGIWLEANEAHISWRLIPMLFGRLDLKEVRAEGLNVERRPNLPPASTPSRASPFDEYRLGNLSIAQLSLAAGVAGPSQTYQLAGNLEASGWTGKLHLDLLPTGGLGDELQADIVWGGDALLEGEIDLIGAPDGMIAQVLGLRAGEGVTANLNASGGILGGEMTALAQIGADTVLDVDARADRRDYQASGRIVLSRFKRFETIARRLGEEIEFAVSVDPDQSLSAEILAPTGAVEISGDLVSTEEERSLENLKFNAIRLEAPRLSGIPTLVGPELSASGRVRQAGGRFVFDGRIEAQTVSYGRYSFTDVSSDGIIDFAGGTLSVDSQLKFAPQAGLPEQLQTALGRSVIADLTGTYSRTHSLISIEGASFRGEQLSLTGAGTVRPGGSVALTGSIGLRDVLVAKMIAGNYELSGESFSDLELVVEGIAVPASTAPHLIQGLAPTISYKAKAARRGNSIAIDQVELRSDGITAEVSGTVEPDRIALMGRAEALMEDQIKGLTSPLSSQFSVSGTPAEPDITLSLNGAYQGDPVRSKLSGQVQDGRFIASAFEGEWRELITTGRGVIEFASLQDSALSLEIDGRVPNLSSLNAEISYDSRKLASQAKVIGFEVGGAIVETADINLAGNWPEFSGTVTYQAEIPVLGASQMLAGNHPLQLNADARSLKLAGDATIGGQQITIKSPLTVSADPAVQIEGVLAGFGGEIELDVDNSGERPSRLSLMNIALADLAALIQRPGLIGTLNGEADVQLSEQGPGGSVSLRISGLSRAGLGIAPANLISEVQLLDGRMLATASVTPPEADVSLTASLGTDLIDSGSIFSIRQAPDARMPIKLSGNGEIAPLWALAGLDLRLGGQFALDLSNGDGRTFRFSGPASLANGVLEDGITGIYLEDLEANLQFDSDAITVQQASARGARGGSITASGTYNFNGDSDLEANLTRLRALRREDVSTTLSGQARIERRDRRTHVAGDILIDEMRVDLSKLPRAGYTVLDVQFGDEIEDDEDQSPTREAISLDLDVKADRRVFVDGPSFESEWGVDAKVRGSPGDPILTGAATLVRGEANVIGQRFDLSEGRIQFSGRPANSELNLRADRTNDGVTTMITLSGEVTDPEITLSSDPNLPEDEVLARVLFGRSPSNLSPLQAAQLASAAAQLAGGDAFSLTGELQDATGLDRLDFGVDDEGQATLSTGKYLADDVYLEIESGATGAPAVALEWTPLQNVEVDAEVDPELGPKVAIQWKRDFDRLPGEPRQE